MSVETPPSPGAPSTDSDHRRDVRVVVARVATWFASSTESNPPAHPESIDERPRRWDVVNPAATRIGHPEGPDDDLDDRLRALHAERDARMCGNEDRRRKLDVARITQGICNSLDLTAWERDRVLGVICELDPDTFENRHSLSQVVLAVTGRVVDAERRAWLGLDDEDWLDGRPPERVEELADRLQCLTDDETFDDLLAECDLTPEGIERLNERLDRELDECVLEEAVFGRSPYRNPALPAFDHAISSNDRASASADDFRE